MSLLGSEQNAMSQWSGIIRSKWIELETQDETSASSMDSMTTKAPPRDHVRYANVTITFNRDSSVLGEEASYNYAGVKATVVLSSTNDCGLIHQTDTNSSNKTIIYQRCRGKFSNNTLVI